MLSSGSFCLRNVKSKLILRRNHPQHVISKFERTFSNQISKFSFVFQYLELKKKTLRCLGFNKIKFKINLKHNYTIIKADYSTSSSIRKEIGEFRLCFFCDSIYFL